LFLPRLSQGDAQDIAIAVGLPAELQPLLQLAMVSQQRPRPVAIDDPGRAGDMTDLQRSLEAICVRLDEFSQRRGHGGFLAITWLVRIEFVEQRLPVHGYFKIPSTVATAIGC